MTEEFYFLKQNEDGEFEQYEPYITVSVNTEEDYEFMKQAIERQKVKKPILTHKVCRIGKCQTCEQSLYLDDKDLFYCPTCGQKIK